MLLAYAALVLVVLAASVLLWRVMRPQPRLRVGNRGILDPELGWGWILWDEIEGAWPPTAGQGETLHLRLRVSQRLARILARRRRAADPGSRRIDVKIDLRGSGWSPVELLQRIVSRQ